MSSHPGIGAKQTFPCGMTRRCLLVLESMTIWRRPEGTVCSGQEPKTDLSLIVVLFNTPLPSKAEINALLRGPPEDKLKNGLTTKLGVFLQVSRKAMKVTL